MSSLPTQDDEALRTTRNWMERALLAAGPRTELILIRHGMQRRTTAEESRAGGPRLSELGVRQARALADYLADHDIAALYCSTITRAHATAEAIADRHPAGLIPEVWPELREIEVYGDGDNPFPPADVQDRAAAEFHRTRRWDAFPNTESSTTFRDRLLKAATVITDKHPNQRVAVVSHGGAISSLLSAVLGITDDMWVYSAHTGITRLLCGDDRWAVGSINETPHLTPDLLSF
ncbi:histidine phosphatase family protein [Nocardia farcinica]|uniref:histidine phosphatase family protein n=1 Tax=Nocardia farcinica TaxID=37329 RepID=UPI0015F0E2F0|nr:histidine phosphatase family protein [Nocardia farcinica]MBA4857468.1 histidine phosphatase family protein [Nocardia farcinica]MBC9816233.1 histidine phosphatase family protein [Nocardia farcinica]MBF6262364.1 histidine phosphatase family protein [Nocardia farcinica]MBF6280904.1 histidine phosphatase family protein [Nocardia farcinica]MBF6304640.1 histidine phosphatase family protein [Nocardia farcinica]